MGFVMKVVDYRTSQTSYGRCIQEREHGCYVGYDASNFDDTLDTATTYKEDLPSMPGLKGGKRPMRMPSDCVTLSPRTLAKRSVQSAPFRLVHKANTHR